jgi:hypothetical protein
MVSKIDTVILLSKIAQYTMAPKRRHEDDGLATAATDPPPHENTNPEQNTVDLRDGETSNATQNLFLAMFGTGNTTQSEANAPMI